MYSARCPNSSCGCEFKSVSSGSVACPHCGTAALIVLDVAATVDPTPVVPIQRDDLPITVDGPLARLGDEATVDEPSATSASFSTPAQPATIGRFRVRAKLGAGAFGEVYRAHDPQLDRDIALKVAKPGALDSPERVGRFLREARAAANLRHPHIVPVFDSGRDGERHYIASGFIDGRTLEAEIEVADGAPLDLKRATSVVRKLAEALGYAHKQGVVHRDVKPANVLVDTAGEPSLTDFGLAVRAGDEAVKTQDGRVMGTPAYMSPEQAAGKSAEATAASDQYALGVMLYEMATGRRPFEGPFEIVIVQQIQVEPRTPRAENRLIPKDLETVILKCLEKEPGKRYATCEALAEDLRRFLDGEPVTARRIGPVERFGRWARRNPAIASLLVLVALVTVVGVLVGLWQYGQVLDERNRAVKAEWEEKTRSEELGVALREKTGAEAEVSKKAADLVAETRKLAAALDEMSANFSNARILQAWAAWGTGDAKRTRELLRQVPAGYRRWEWAYLARQTVGGLFTLYGHVAPVVSVSFSPDGTRVVTGSFDNTARVWDARTGATIVELKGHRAAVSSASFSPDGTRVLTLSDDGMARVWNATTGAAGAELRGHRGRVYSASFSPDGSRVVTASQDGTARVWDVTTGDMVNELKVRLEGSGPVGVNAISVNAAVFSPDGSQVATASADKMARVWNAQTGALLTELKGHTDVLYAVSFAPDGSRIVTGSLDNTARLWDAKTGGPIAELKGPMGAVRSVSFSPDGARVVTAYDRVARVWNSRSGALEAELTGHTARIASATFSPDGTCVATASFDGTARVWNAWTGVVLTELKGHTDGVVSASFSPDGTRVATVSFDQTARLWDTRSDPSSTELKGHTDYVRAASFSPDGTRVATVSFDNTARVWDVRTRAVISELKVPTEIVGPATAKWSAVYSAGFSPDGACVLLTSGGNTVRLWDLRTGTVTELKGHSAPVRSARLSPDGARVLTTSDDNTARIWEAKTGAAVIELKGQSGVLSAAFSQDGARVVFASLKVAQVRDTATGAVIAELQGRGEAIFSASFSPDGTRVGTAGGGTTAHVWDVATGAVIAELKGHTEVVYSVSFSPDGSRVMTASGGNAGRVWDAGAGTTVAVLKGHLEGRYSGSFSPDGARVLTTNGTETARVWDARTGVVVAELKGHTGEVDSAAFSPDGASVVTASWDKTARIWDATAGKVVLGTVPPAAPGPSRVSPDGKSFLYTGEANVVREVPIEIGADEVALRRHSTSPRPEWHRTEADRLAAVDPFAAAMQRSFEQRAFAALAIEAGDLDRARAHLIRADELAPKPPKLLELAPPPRPVGRRRFAPNR